MNIMNMRPTRLASFLGLAMAALLLSACASSKQDKSLEHTLRQYEMVVRWSQWDGAVDFLAPAYLATSPISRLDMDRLRLFRVTQYTVRSAIPFDDGMALRQAVEIGSLQHQADVRVRDQDAFRVDHVSERSEEHTSELQSR